MNIVVFGAAGFLGTNLVKKLDREHQVLALDEKIEYFDNIYESFRNTKIEQFKFEQEADFISVLEGRDVVYHLVSTTIPSTSNQKIVEELHNNIVITAKLLDACVQKKIGKIVFISSGGTVYGKEVTCPISEDSIKRPINSYGLQKSTIEDMLYLYNYIYGLDYRILRLSNPYGPYQRPNGKLGVVTNFIYNSLLGKAVNVWGTGETVRDYIYVEDAIDAVLNVVNDNAKYKIYNIGSGIGINILDLLKTIDAVLNKETDVIHMDARSVDVPVNYLDITRYCDEFGNLANTELADGIRKTANFISEHYLR